MGMPIQINDFLQSFSREAKFCLSLPVFWSVSIDGVTTDAINSVLESAGEKWSANLTPNDMSKGDAGSILVAQTVTLPTESSEFVALDFGSGKGGFLPTHAMNSRTNFLNRSFSVNILETAQDLEHEFFRPWLIALGIKGLIEDGGPSLKATMVVKQYDNQGNFRKGYKFKGVHPSAIESYTLDYDSTQFIIKSVGLVCLNYEPIFA
jgi:hypothetical protein